MKQFERTVPDGKIHLTLYSLPVVLRTNARSFLRQTYIE